MQLWLYTNTTSLSEKIKTQFSMKFIHQATRPQDQESIGATSVVEKMSRLKDIHYHRRTITSTTLVKEALAGV
jgi:hypothetical protein